MLTRADPDSKVMLSDTAYNRIKSLVQIWLPAISSLYFSLGAIWGFPAVEQVVGTIACIMTFLGATLLVSSNRYEASGAGYDGEVVTTQVLGTDKVLHSLELNGDPEDILADKSSIRFKVLPPVIEEFPGVVEDDIPS